MQMQCRWQTVTFLGVDDAVSARSERVQLTFRGGEHIVLDHGIQELPGTRATQKSVKVDVAHPPDDVWVSFTPKGRDSHERNPKEPGDVMGPQVGASRFRGGDLMDQSQFSPFGQTV
jgi:hypothetical protein